MGVKEESLTVRIVAGFSGKIRPQQTEGGPCTVCKETVWIDLPKDDGNQYNGTIVIHHACDAR